MKIYNVITAMVGMATLANSALGREQNNAVVPSINNPIDDLTGDFHPWDLTSSSMVDSSLLTCAAPHLLDDPDYQRTVASQFAHNCPVAYSALGVASNLERFTDPVAQQTIAQGIFDVSFSSDGYDNAVYKEFAKNLGCLSDPIAQQWIVQAIQERRFGDDPEVLAILCKQERAFTVFSSPENNYVCADQHIKITKTPRPKLSSEQFVNLNTKVQFIGSDERIVCHHLSMSVLNNIDPVSGMVAFEQYGTVKKIAATVPFSVYQQAIDIVQNSPEKHLINNDDFGKLLVSQFEKMHQEGVSLKKMLILTMDHAMAVWLIARIEQCQPVYIVHFYDPNLTNVDMAFESRYLDGIKTLSLKAFIHFRYPKEDSLSTILIVPDSSEPSNVAPKFIAHNIASSATAVRHMMANNFAEELKAYTEYIQTLPEIRRLAILAAKNKSISGLYLALQYGHSEVIQIYGDLLKVSGISGKNLLNVLIAKANADFPGLYMALRQGHAKAIRVYGELLKAFAISDKDLLSLLAAKRSDGTPGFYFSLQYGHAEAIEAYGQLLKVFGISDDDLLDLLAAKRSDGYPGLSAALQVGNSKAIRAYGELLKVFGISGDDLLDLLAAKRSDGIPGLSVALQLGNAEAIKAYGAVLMQLSDRLSPNQIAKLLSDSALGRKLAVQNNHVDAVKAYDALKKWQKSLSKNNPR